MNKYIQSSYNNYVRRYVTKYTIFLASIFLLIVSLFLAYHIRSFNSDDVAWQNALMTWRPFSGHPLYWSPDTWVLKIPVYLLVEKFLGHTRRAVFVEAAMFSMANFTLFFFSSLYFLKKIWPNHNALDLLPFLWLSSFGLYFTTLFLNTNLRSIEIGLSFVLFMLVAKLFYGEFDKLKREKAIAYFILASFCVGILIYNDPYFLYFSVLPITILSVFYYLINESRRKRVYAFMLFLITSLLFWKIIAKIGLSAGIHVVPQQVQFVAFENLFPQIASTLQSVLTIFGADFTGRAVLNLITFTILLNFVILIYIISVIYKTYRNNIIVIKKFELSRLLKLFFVLCPVFILIVYLSSSLATPGTYRYLVLLPFFGVIIAVLGLQDLNVKIRNTIYFILIFSAAFNVGYSIYYSSGKNSIISGYSINRANNANFNLIHTLEEYGLNKGYSQYWEGNINTYLSNGRLSVLPVMCPNKFNTRFNWMINGSKFNDNSINSFMLVDNAPLMSTPQCTYPQILSQFGEPKKIVISGSTNIYIYNYDIGKFIH